MLVNCYFAFGFVCWLLLVGYLWLDWLGRFFVGCLWLCVYLTTLVVVVLVLVLVVVCVWFNCLLVLVVYCFLITPVNSVGRVYSFNLNWWLGAGLVACYNIGACFIV